MEVQPTLTSEIVTLCPLEEKDFEALFSVASDPLIWEQHPNPDRYKRKVFKVFWEGALASRGAFKIVDNTTKQIIGSTRFYDYNPENKSIFIGYTFYSRAYWGTPFNATVKKMLLAYAFQWVDKVYFHIGAQNFRSQKAIAKIGAQKVREIVVAYHGEPEKTNFEYVMEKRSFLL